MQNFENYLFYNDLLDRINHFADDRHIPVWGSRIIL